MRDDKALDSIGGSRAKDEWSDSRVSATVEWLIESRRVRLFPCCFEGAMLPWDSWVTGWSELWERIQYKCAYFCAEDTLKLCVYNELGSGDCICFLSYICLTLPFHYNKRHTVNKIKYLHGEKSSSLNNTVDFSVILQIQNEESVVLFLVAWTVTEITRYSFYTFSLLNHLPYFIKWARWRCLVI